VHDKPNQHVMVTRNEQVVPLKAQGWNHFSK
jgi:hypothetical protein